MCNLVHIDHDGRSWVFENKHSENTDMFYDRCWFIIQHHNKTDYSRKTLENIASLWINKKYLGISYCSKMEELLSTFARNSESPLQCH